MEMPTVSTATVEDRERVFQTITLGFSSDPVSRWIWPEADSYLTNMRKFVEAFGGRAFDHESAYFANDCNAAALWLPPGTDPDGETMEQIMSESVREEIAEEVGEFLAGMDRFHPHDEPCWYLPMIAADPAFLGQGLGAALMKHALQRCDEDGLMAYLESSNPRNISLYQRHGFDVIGEIQVGSSPIMTPMIRPARR